MGMRTGYISQNVGSVGRVYAELKIKLNGSGTSGTVLGGGGFLAAVNPVVHVGGTNVWTVTLRDGWPEVVTHSVDERDDAGSGTYATIGSFTGEGVANNTPITFKIQTFTAGGSASNDSSLVVVVNLALRNSNETYGN